MKTEIKKRIENVRDVIAKEGLAAVIIPQADPHHSEYLASHWQARKYLSGFSGSAGTLVVLKDKDALWTDSRYFLQATDQLEGTGIELMKMAIPGVPTIEEFLCDNLKAGDKVGIDGLLFSVKDAKHMRNCLDKAGIQLVTDFDIVDKVWPDRPSMPKGKVFIHETKYSGESADSKIAKIKNAIDADAILISALDEIAWLLNIRCDDVKYNPVATSYLYIGKDKTILFIDPDKLNDEVKAYLASQGVEYMPYDKVVEFVSSLAGKKVQIDIDSTSAKMAESLGENTVFGTSPVGVPKACRNEVQIQGIRKAMVRDGVAMVRAFIEMYDMLDRSEKLTELDVARLLREYRSQQDLFVDESFGTIAGYGSHGAIVHYEPTEESNAEIKKEGLLLIDSGAQFLDGTTDITRTISMGNPTALEKRDFTLVLKGHIALSRAVYPAGTRGSQLDVLARQYLWRDGIVYLHGTGHGVGHFLNVHEGPQSIRLNDMPTPLMLGMVTSNEPGLYRTDVHGVRCENLVLTVPAFSNDGVDFLKFEDLTLFPFDWTLIDMDMITPDELEWLNAYHKNVYDKLSPHLNDKEKAWLKKACNL